MQFQAISIILLLSRDMDEESVFSILNSETSSVQLSFQCSSTIIKHLLPAAWSQIPSLTIKYGIDLKKKKKKWLAQNWK